ncbi:MAG: P-loop NTPase fold protein [Bryobacter sp.]|nr:P-loop NTPase fold protein [Bryobacter sp.]
MQIQNVHDPYRLLSSDHPISDRASDKLERRAFAEAIASAISGWRGRDSLVIALYGPWGTGKSSIKNMVIDDLKHRSGKNSPTIIDFNPWQFANREQLLETFFDQIGLALGRGACASKKDKKQLLQRWRRYAASLRAGASLVEHVRNAVVLALLIGAASVGLAATQSQDVSYLLFAVLVGLAAILRWFSRCSEIIVDLIKVRVEIGKNSIEELKADLSVRLRSLNAPLLVVIDDVDRLVPDETLELFQLIKMNADFPNLVYLVLFDRHVVEKNVQKVLEVNGRQYMEKIVQVGFDIPEIERIQVNRALSSGLDQLLSESAASMRFSKPRWDNLFLGGIQANFRTLRDVNRFLSTLAFHVSLFRSDTSFEVNPVDLIGIEVLRVFHPEVYQAVATNKNILTGGFSRDKRSEEDRNAILGIPKLASKSKEEVQEIVRQLFPSVDWAFQGYSYGKEFEDEWLRDLRVCSSKVFDRYFHFAILSNDVPQAAIDKLLTNTANRVELGNQLKFLKAKGQLPQALDRLRCYKYQIPVMDLKCFVCGLFDNCDRISDSKYGPFESHPISHAINLVYWLVCQESEKEARFSALEAAIRESNGLELCVLFVSYIDDKNKNAEGGRFEPFISEAGLSALKELCLKKIEKDAASGQLASRSELSSILFIWKKWGGSDEAKSY